MKFELARAVADAVLMEGYALYPYRASSLKNRFRWTFGVLAPRSWSINGGCEPWWLQVQLLVAGKPQRLAGRLRFFQIERRRLDDSMSMAHWDEGVLREIDFPIDDGRTCVPFTCDRYPSLVGNIVLDRELV